MTPHNAVVLAAGGSRRLGRPKQWLTRDHESLVHRSVRLARETGAHRLLLVCGSDADAVLASVDDLHVEVLINPHWEEGLASSLRLAACALALERLPCMLMGCDQPALERAHLHALLDGYAARGCAATLHADSRGIPAVVPAELLAQALTLQGDRGLRSFLNARAADEIFLLDARALQLDIDTPDDVLHAQSLGWLDASTPA